MAESNTAKVFGDRYEVVQFLARGGFGAVYKVRDRNFRERYLALKVLDTSALGVTELANVFLAKFEDEANVQVGLRHPGIVPVHDYRPDRSEPFIVMELIEGGTLADVLKGRRMDWPGVVDLGAQVAESLHYAHTHGVRAHRDIKPANIFCPEPGRYLVGDFGIARVQHTDPIVTRSFFASAGTPAYMAPEQLLDPSSVDGRTDEFALATVLYEALAQKRPFNAVALDHGTDRETAERIVSAAYAKIPPLRALNSDVPKTLVDVIERALDTDQSRRFPTCGDFAAALRSTENSGRQLRPTAPLIAAMPPMRVGDESAIDLDRRVIQRPINLDFDGGVADGFPYGWFDSSGFVSNVSTGYSVAVVKRDPSAGRCLELRAPRPHFDGFGSVMQRCAAVYLRGRMVRLIGELKSNGVEGWAGLWLRLDGRDVPNLFFDNMSGNPVRGTTDWRSYKVEAVVPNEAEWMNYGVVLNGGGTVWADSFRLLVWTSSGDWAEV